MKRIVTAVCAVVMWSGSVGASVCGDATVEGGEVCDPPFAEGGCSPGFLCNDTCSGCVDQSLCGNGTSDAAEACDPPAAFDGCPSGLVCNDTCTTCLVPLCDNGVVEGSETCDPPYAASACPSGLVCNTTCTGCMLPACGNGVIELTETCDGQTACPAGFLCNDTCAGCVDQSLCGNGTLDPAEPCDPPYAASACPSGLVCKTTCTGCMPPVCGNGVIELTEACDPPNAQGVCPTNNLCNATCAGCIDLATCGNGTPDPFEACDPPGQVDGCAPGFSCSTNCIRCGSTVPIQATLQKGEFVKAYVLCNNTSCVGAGNPYSCCTGTGAGSCNAGNTATSNFFPACTPAIESDPKCKFLSNGKGKYLAKFSKNGPDKLPGTTDDSDIELQASFVNLDIGCEGQTLSLTASVRATADDCNGGQACTVINLNNLNLAQCTVVGGKCKIKTFTNISFAPGTILPGKKLGICIVGVNVFNGANQLFWGGIFVP